MNYIDVGNTNVWNAIAYGQQNPVNINYFQNQLQNIQTNLNQAAVSFYQDAQSIYDKFTNSDALRSIRIALKGAANLFNGEVIKSIFDVEDFQTASFTMQRWVMANPVVRQMYHDQKCDGYSDTYIDAEPNKIGDSHYDYRRVMDGVVVADEEQEYYKHYYEDIFEGDKELTHTEKVDILTTWEIVELFMKTSKLDPTSPYGSSL